MIDNLSGKLYLIVYVDPALQDAFAQGQHRLAALRAQLAQAVVAPEIRPTQTHEAVRDSAKADYLAAVERAKELISGGDFMQVQVGQRIKKRYTEAPLSLYRALRSLSPSPYMYYYNFSGADGQGCDFHVVEASPEILVRQEQVFSNGVAEQKVTIRPLAGTRPRGVTPELDKAAEEELVGDPKERAEHVMLIDLARNDIGRIAKIGTVKVTDAFCVERYSHVMHIVSNVEGTLLDGMTSMDVLKATFPAGTLTGALKVHAMELIDQLEPIKRGIYGGACGYLSYAGDNVWEPSPPVPTISTSDDLSTISTLVENSRMICAAAVILKMVSFLTRNPAVMAAIMTVETSPDMIWRIRCSISS